MKPKDVKIINMIFAPPAQKGDSSFVLGLGDDNPVYFCDEVNAILQLFTTK